jgi:hypothetical protein
VVIGAVAIVVAASAIAGGGASEEIEPSTAIAASAGEDIADSLPYASTTSSTELPPTTTTAAPTTTTTAAPTTTTTAAPTTTTTAPPPLTTVAPQASVAAPAPVAPASDGCHPSYEPCVPITSDVDCAGGSGNGPAYTGRVSVVGPDEYDLDRDGDGVGCEG